MGTSYDLRVVQVVEETPDAHSMSLQVPEASRDEFSYRPGQFLAVAVPYELTGVGDAECLSNLKQSTSTLV